MTAEGAGPLGLLATEFGDWEVSLRPCGLSLATAYRCSDDGHHRRFIVAPTAGVLLARLRAIRQQERDPVPPPSLAGKD